MTIALLILRYTWPFVLAGGIWLWQETRIAAITHSLVVSEKRATEAESRIVAAQKRATDLALLYANTLPKIDQAAREQKEKDDATIKSLQARVDKLSREPTLYFSADALRVFNDVSGAGSRTDAATDAGTAGRPAPVPQAAAPEAGGYYSEADITGHDVAARAAYDACINKLHAIRDRYNAARAAQLKGAQ